MLGEDRNIEISEAFFDENGILCLGAYHPRWGGSNPKFNDFSAAILALKDGPAAAQFQGALDMFEKMARQGLSSALATDWDHCGIAVVPSHDPEKHISGVRLLAKMLSDSNRTDTIQEDCKAGNWWSQECWPSP